MKSLDKTIINIDQETKNFIISDLKWNNLKIKIFLNFLKETENKIWKIYTQIDELKIPIKYKVFLKNYIRTYPQNISQFESFLDSVKEKLNQETERKFLEYTNKIWSYKNDFFQKINQKKHSLIKQKQNNLQNDIFQTENNDKKYAQNLLSNL